MNYDHAVLTEETEDDFVLEHRNCPDEEGNYCSKDCADRDVCDMSGASDLLGFGNDR